MSVLAYSTTSLFAKCSTRGSTEGWLARSYPWCLVVLSAALVLATFDAGNAMASATGQITGTVTNAVTDAPIPHIVACVREAGRNGREECGESIASTGAYEITGVPPGQYEVLFYPVGLEAYDVAKYLSQYYPGVPVWSEEAQPVSVVGGAATSGINAGMHEGGWISGRVTAAGSGAPLEGVDVCARNESGPRLIASCMVTTAHGEYGDFFALEPGAYRIEFGPSRGYQQQYFNIVLLLSEAQPVIIEAGKTIAGIDAALQPAPPAIGEGGSSEVPTSPGPFPDGTGPTGPVSAPYSGAANEQFRAQVIEREAQLQKAKEQEEHKAKEAAASYTAEQAAVKPPACVVPSLKGDTLAVARRALLKAHCRLGRVSLHTHRGSTPHVISQSTQHGKRLPAGTTIAVTLGSRRV